MDCFIIPRPGGANYGKVLSREHAALAPMVLGIRFVLSKSFARIHRPNLVNFGILPLQLAKAAEDEHLHQADDLVIENAPWALKPDQGVIIKNRTSVVEIRAHQTRVSPFLAWTSGVTA